MNFTKEVVRQYWDAEPCGTRGIPCPVGSLEFFNIIAENRKRLEPFIADYAKFDGWAGRQVLEVGCGIGSELLRFAQARADVIGVDLSPKSVSLTKTRLKVYDCCGDVLIADAEKLPFANGEFDFVFSWGVLHHIPDIAKAVREIYRVLKPDGEICIMLYHRHSLVALQMYLLFGLFAFKPFRGLDDIFANHHESIGTRVFTVDEAYRMFSAFKDLSITVRLTPYDLRWRRDKYLPRWVGRVIPKRFGWFMIIRGRKYE